MLAYVFWHRPRAGIAEEEYRVFLSAFHDSIDARSWFSGLKRAPWAEEAGWYEDWYLVDDWAGLGELNAAAVSGARETAHANVAAIARDGIAGIYSLRRGTPAAPGWAAWLGKPTRRTYADFELELEVAAGEDATIWQRQMTLGPTPEFAVLAPGPRELPWPAVETSPE